MICAICGGEHPLEDMELSFRQPDEAVQLSVDERTRLVKANSDVCVIGGERFFIRALLPLPVESRELAYCIGVWVEVSAADFERIGDVWNSEEQANELPFEAHIANEIPTASGSLGLNAELRLTGPATRPEVFLQPSRHQLFIEQSSGIAAHRASEYSALFA